MPLWCCHIGHFLPCHCTAILPDRRHLSLLYQSLTPPLPAGSVSAKAGIPLHWTGQFRRVGWRSADDSAMGHGRPGSHAFEGALWGGAVISPVKLDPAETDHDVEASSRGEALLFNRRMFWISVSTPPDATRVEAKRLKRHRNSQFQWLERLFTKSV